MNTTKHTNIKTKPTDVMPSTYVDFDVQNNDILNLNLMII